MTLTAAQVMQDARSMANQPANSWPDDDTLLIWCNSMMEDLYDLVIDKDMYQVSYVSASVTPNSVVTPAGDLGIQVTGTGAIVTDYYRDAYLDLVVSNSPVSAGGPGRINVPRLDESQRNNVVAFGYPTAGSGPNNGLVGYIPEGNNLLLLPAAAAPGTYWLRYYPLLPPLTTLQSTVAQFLETTGWWRYLSYGLAAMIAQSIDKDPSVFLQAQAQQRARVEHAAANREMKQGKRLDPRRGRQNMPYGNGWGRFF